MAQFHSLSWVNVVFELLNLIGFVQAWGIPQDCQCFVGESYENMSSNVRCGYSIGQTFEILKKWVYANPKYRPRYIIQRDDSPRYYPNHLTHPSIIFRSNSRSITWAYHGIPYFQTFDGQIPRLTDQITGFWCVKSTFWLVVLLVESRFCFNLIQP